MSQNNPLEIKKIVTKKHRIWVRSLMKANIIPTHPSISIFCGAAGGGKSTLCVNMLQNPNMYGYSFEGVLPEINKITGAQKPIKEEPYYDIVFLLIGSADDMWDHCIDEGLIEKENVIFDPVEDDVQKIINTQNAMLDYHKGDITKVPKILIICDDLANNAKLLRSNAIKTLFVKSRHLNASIWFLTQYLNLVPKACRLQNSSFFMFKFAKSEGELLVEQFCPPNVDKRAFLEMCVNATKYSRDENGKRLEGNNFLLIMKKAAEGKQFRQNFNRYIYPEGFEPEFKDEVDFKELIKENNDERKKLHEEAEEQKYVKQTKAEKKYEYVNKFTKGAPISFIRMDNNQLNPESLIKLKVRKPRVKK